MRMSAAIDCYVAEQWADGLEHELVRSELVEALTLDAETVRRVA